MALIARLRDFGCRPRGQGADWLAHIPREENARADQLAGDPHDECRILTPWPWPRHMRVKTDGASSNRRSGCGWELWGCRDASGVHDDDAWICLAEASWALPSHTLPIEAEFCGLLSSLSFICRLVQEGAMGDGGPGDAPVRPDWIAAAARPRLWAQVAWNFDNSTRTRTMREMGAGKRQPPRTQGDCEGGEDDGGRGDARRRRNS